jgi:ligand-binding sensor domain-containing protein
MNRRGILQAYWIYLVITFLVSSSVVAQQLPLLKIGLKEGLPQSTVFRMRQDNFGYMWFATQGGLCRYDGVAFKVYSQYDGIGSNFIRDLEFDKTGRLWIATMDKGISCFNGSQFTQFNTSGGLRSDEIRYFTKTSSGDIFICSIDQGVIWIDPYLHQRIILTPEGEKFEYARKAIEWKNGNVWIAYGNGIVELVKSNNYRPRYKFDNHFEMISLSEDVKGDVWAGGVNCLYEFTTDTFFDYSDLLPENTEVWDILENSSTGEIYLATTNGLIIKKRNEITRLTMANGLTVNDLRSLYRDMNGHIWAGSQGGGVMILENKGIDHFNSTDKITGFAANTMAEDGEGNMWIGTNNQGLIQSNGKEIKQSPAVQLSDMRDALTSSYDRKAGSVYMADYDGRIIELNSGKVKWRWNPKTSGPLRLLNICYHKNVLYLSTQNGFFILNKNDGKLNKLDALGDKYCGYSFADKESNIWILTEKGGIYRYRNGKVKDFTMAINPEHASLTQGIYDPYHHLYWFTSYSGLIIWDHKRSYHLHSRNGLLSDSPWSIGQDHNGDIWLGHANGIERVSYRTKSIKSFGYDQGFTPIETNSCAIHCDHKGNIWFGTINSASRIRVNDISLRKAIVNLCVQKIWVNEKLKYEQDLMHNSIDRLNLTWHENNITIDLMGICFDNAKDVTYSWYLQGFDSKWSTWDTQAKAVYANLHPGVYTFKAKAKDPNGYETQPITLKIVIRKPIWNYWWFYAIEICIMGFIIYLSFTLSVDPEKNKLGNLLTLVSILIIFEGTLIYVSEYVDNLTAGIPIFQLIMNVLLAGTLHPLEQFIRKFMRRWALKRRRQKTEKVQDTSD